MPLESLTITLLFTLLVLVGYLIYKLSKQNTQNKQLEPFNTQQISQEILLGMSDKMQNWQDKQNQILNQQNITLAENTGNLKLLIEQKIGEMQLDLTQNLNQNLNQNQDILQNRLEKSLLHTTEVIKNNLEILHRSSQEKLDQINLDVQKRLDENFGRSLKSFEEVTKSLGQMEERAGAMIDSTKSIEKLNQVFARTSSKAFGTFAEDYLESLLKEHLLAHNWDKQVKVPASTEIIDFVIKVNDYKIGIDAKFPLTKYQDYINSDLKERDQKRREYHASIVNMSSSISQKYYQNNFVDKLFLYLPSDSMYTDCLDNTKLVELIQKYKVSILSPNTLFAQLAIIQSNQVRAHITDNAEQIIKGLGNIKRNIESFRDEYRKLGDKLKQAQGNYEQADRALLGVENNIILLQRN
jgi:DNA recombination protein RmuC